MLLRSQTGFRLWNIGALRWIFHVRRVPVTTTWSVLGFRMEGPKQLNMDIRFGAWNFGLLYRAGSLVTVSKELSEYIRFSGSAGGQMGGRWHRTCKKINIFLRKGD
jgi:hypothetical protein